MSIASILRLGGTEAAAVHIARRRLGVRDRLLYSSDGCKAQSTLPYSSDNKTSSSVHELVLSPKN